MTKYIAFHNDPALQSKMLAAVDAHVKHDHVVQATYGTGNGKQFRGSFIGCTVHAFAGDTAHEFNSPARVHDAYGFPPILTRICEQVFEGLPTEDAPAFFRAVPNALNLGADLSLAAWKFLYWMAVEALGKLSTDKQRESCANAVSVLIDRANGVDVPSQRDDDEKGSPSAIVRATYMVHSEHTAYAAAACVANDDYWASHYATAAVRAASRYDADAYQRFAAKLIKLIGEAK